MKKNLLLLTFFFSVILFSNSQSWQKLGVGIHELNGSPSINSITTDNWGTVYAAGDFADTSGKKNIARWNGKNWYQVGTDTNGLNANGSISSIVLDNTNKVYAAGFFKNQSNNFYVAKWNGQKWSEIGSGTNSLNANGPIILANDNVGNIYAANFSTSYTSQFVAKWDG